MREDLEWLRCRDIGIENVEDVESLFGVKLPQDFREVIISHSGGCPLPHTYDFGEHDEAVLHNLLNFDKEEKYNVFKTYNLIKDRLQDKIYPFAEDPYGNHICFDYRESKENPKVVFCDHELTKDDSDNFQFICNSFTELIDKLYED